jgi:hypothetical protein
VLVRPVAGVEQHVPVLAVVLHAELNYVILDSNGRLRAKAQGYSVISDYE